MQKVILKFEVSTGNVCKIEMPEDAQILCVNTQLRNSEKIFIWALCDVLKSNSNKKVTRSFVAVPTGAIFETGANVPVSTYFEGAEGTGRIDHDTYIGTAFFKHVPDPLLYHIFEIK